MVAAIKRLAVIHSVEHFDGTPLSSPEVCLVKLNVAESSDEDDTSQRKRGPVHLFDGRVGYGREQAGCEEDGKEEEGGDIDGNAGNLSKEKFGGFGQVRVGADRYSVV